ncbi:MAG: hypothetical protein K2N28_07580 [Muribaculaceae bacterium]|nr:hypothetical protein [Muribaculaceae bacterium]
MLFKDRIKNEFGESNGTNKNHLARINKWWDTDEFDLDSWYKIASQLPPEERADKLFELFEKECYNKIEKDNQHGPYHLNDIKSAIRALSKILWP